MAAASIIMSSQSTNGAVVRSMRIPKYSHISTESFKRNYEMLCDELEMNSLITDLKGRNILTNSDIDKIKHQTHRRRKAAAFLDAMLARGNDDWIDGVLLCLEQNHNMHIIQQLGGTRTAVRNMQYRIRALRPTLVEERIWVEDEEMTNAIQMDQDAQILEDARDTLDFSIVNIYAGSLCFLLDAQSDTAILEMWRNDKNIPKIRSFLKKILRKYKTRQFFQQKRQIKVEISEKANDFIFRVNDGKSNREIQAVNVIEPRFCSGCFRQTVLDSYHIILDEVETHMMEETFKNGLVPGCIKTACIEEKQKRSRSERADIFLQFVLTSEELLMEFKNIFSSMSEIRLNSSNCALHKGQTNWPLKFREKLVFYFEVSYNEKDNIFKVTSINKELRKSWPSLDAIDVVSKSKAHIDSAWTDEIRVVVIGLCKRDANLIVRHLFQVDTSETTKTTDVDPDSLSFVEANFKVPFAVTTVSSTMFSGNYSGSIAKCIAMTSPGPHIVLIAIPDLSHFNIDNFNRLLKPLTNVFGRDIEHYLVPTFDEMVKEHLVLYGRSSQFLHDIFERRKYLSYDYFGNRMQTIKNLLRIIEQTKFETGKQFFTNTIYAETEKLFEQRSRDHAMSRLNEYRQQEREIATLKEKLQYLEHEQRKIKDSSTRESIIHNIDHEGIVTNISDLLFKRMSLLE